MNTTPVLVVEDDAQLCHALVNTLQLNGFAVTGVDSAASALAALEQGAFALIISDVQMEGMNGHQLLAIVKKKYPQIPAILITAYGTIQKAVEALHGGAADYIVKPFDIDTLLARIKKVLGTISFTAAENAPVENMLVADEKSRQLLQLAYKVAQTDVAVMIGGESGVGKEVLARYIHSHSPRHRHGFVALNCAAIPENMLEATLFGYEKGAFTGAYQGHPGKFEQAQGGTLLLDEITEMALGLQAKLLRVLQEKEVERLGGKKTINLDVRVIATSNRELKNAVTQGYFREDLYYRLNVFPLHISPLRERRADIIPLARYFLHKHARHLHRPIPEFDEAAVADLTAYHWPGNIRELENSIQRALVMQNAAMIGRADLQLPFETSCEPKQAAIPLVESPVVENPGDHTLEQNLILREQKLILNTLQECAGSRHKAAAQLGISPRTLRYKLARLRENGINLKE